MTAPPPPPPPNDANPVLAEALAQLEKFGYGDRTGDAARDWARLKSDFATPPPDLDRLSPPARAAAERYIAGKRRADALLGACEAAHAEMLAHGLDRRRTESYAQVRDAYEDSVEAFAAAGAEVARCLSAG